MRPENKSTYFKIEITKEGDKARGTIEINIQEQPAQPVPATEVTTAEVKTEPPVEETKEQPTEVTTAEPQPVKEIKTKRKKKIPENK